MRLVSNQSGWWLVSLHALASAGWMVVMPGGFPVDHSRFWTNRILPLAIITLTAIVIFQGWRGKRQPLRLLLFVLGTFCAAVTLIALVLFSTSAVKVVLAPMLIGLLVWLATFAPSLRQVTLKRPLMLVAISVGALAGALVTFAQRRPMASTHPVNEALPTLPALPEPRGAASIRGIDIDMQSGEVTLQRGSYTVAISPLLTFYSRSPDRCWTNLAPAKDRIGPERKFVGSSRGPGESVWLQYADDDQSMLKVSAVDENEVELCAWSHLPSDVYSHLNAFSRVNVDGHKRLELAFSPCDKAVEPQFMEYPVGAPARCAALFADGRFAVLQASSAEKGPFTPLTAGKLDRAGPLTMTIRDEGRDILAITWFDFAAQASTDLSPTAGYGLPMNAIEFSLYAPDPTSAMGLYMTLAGTSVGRGWDSVGHAAGTYRNRMRIRWLTVTGTLRVP